jgi:hypothetical protein
MAFRAERRVTIARSVEDVWAYVCDVGRWQEWAPTVIECRVLGGGPLQPGVHLEQWAKGILGTSRKRRQEVTAVEAPRHVAFAGPLGTSSARWAMQLEPIDDRQTDTKMWVEVDLENLMRAIPTGAFKSKIERVMDVELAAMRAVLEPATPGGSES